jgi:putative endonuclease
MAYVYILLCENGSYYTGYTTNLERRLDEHKSGKAKYTRAFKPVKILQSWEFETKSEAMKVEYWIKQKSRKQKEAFIQNPENLIIQFNA